MSTQIFSACPHGFSGDLVTVEGDVSRGLPAFTLVGMANKTVSEARDRVRSALTATGFSFPAQKVTVNLAPADLHKEGSHLDLPIALTILLLSKQLRPADVADSLFAGELSLDGAIRPVRGIINILEAGQRAGLRRAFIPEANLPQAQLISGLEIIGVRSLPQLFQTLRGEIPMPKMQKREKTTPIHVKNTKTEVEQGDGFRYVFGQELAKRALIIAIAGRHNILLSGPPGTGKTTLARASAELLAPLSIPESLESTKLHSLAGTTDHALFTRPFRAPHHSASSRAIVGSAVGLPGEISLAHNGILFLDELPEFRRDVLEALRQPLEDGQISLASAHGKVSYPARFILIATMNPCPCGYLGDPEHDCRCLPGQIQRYRNKISGPLLDRIDLCVAVERIKTSELQNFGKTEAKTAVKNTCSAGENNSKKRSTGSKNAVKNTKTGAKNAPATNTKAEARPATPQTATDFGDTGFWRRVIALTEKIQTNRWGNKNFNGNLTSARITEQILITPEAKSILSVATQKLKLSTRAYFKTIKIAQTIADLELASGLILSGKATSAENPAEISTNHLAEALSYRHKEA